MSLAHERWCDTYSIMKDNRPNCYKCLHFQITYDPALPYACRAMKFKSKVLPSAEVFRTSGLSCLAFSPKQKK